MIYLIFLQLLTECILLWQERFLFIREKIRRAMGNLKIPNEKSTVSKYLTVSVGAIFIIPKKDFLFSLLIKVADNALYESKKKGRNRVSYKSEL